MHRPSLAEALVCLQAGFRLFFMRFEAALVFGETPADFWKSFWCAAIMAPLYFFFYIDLEPVADTVQPDPMRLFMGEGIGYVLQWVYWPLAAAYLARLLGKQDRFIRYIAAYNWSQIVPTCLILPIIFLSGTLGLETISVTASFGILAWSMVFRFRLARAVLGVDRMPALLMTMGDQFLGFTILAMAQSVILGGS